MIRVGDTYHVKTSLPNIAIENVHLIKSQHKYFTRIIGLRYNDSENLIIHSKT